MTAIEATTISSTSIASELSSTSGVSTTSISTVRHSSSPAALPIIRPSSTRRSARPASRVRRGTSAMPSTAGTTANPETRSPHVGYPGWPPWTCQATSSWPVPKTIAAAPSRMRNHCRPLDRMPSAATAAPPSTAMQPASARAEVRAYGSPSTAPRSTRAAAARGTPASGTR